MIENCKIGKNQRSLKILLAVGFFLFSTWAIADTHQKLRKGAQTLLLMPRSMAQLIEAHVLEMERDSYFQELSDDDFFHGHFIQRDNAAIANVVNDLPSSISLILYHTAEYNSRWSDEAALGLTPIERNPRSLIGFSNGQVEKAVDHVDLNRLRSGTLRTYNNAGTVYAGDLVEQNRELSSLNYNSNSNKRMKKIEVQFLDGIFDLFFSEMFYILPMPEGRFQLASGESFDIYLDTRNVRQRIGYGEAGLGPILEPTTQLFPY